MRNRPGIYKVGERIGLIIEVGRLGLFVGFWFLTIDIVGGFHKEWF